MAAEWAAAVVTLLILVGFIYGVSVVMLGVTGAGAIALCVVTSLVTLLLAPQLERVAENTRWSGAPFLAGAGIAFLVIGAIRVHPSPLHPLRSALVYAENADSGDAWLGTLAGSRIEWTRSAIGAPTTGPHPQWIARLSQDGANFGRRVQRVSLGAPNASLVRDTIVGGVRRVELRVTAPAGATALVMHALEVKVTTSAIDGRVVDTTRYRQRAREWNMEYWAVPDSGALVALSVPAGAHVDFDVAARMPGIPTVPGVTIPERPRYVVPSQTGDVSVVYREWRF
jgi:hypothetical protein